MPDRGAVTLVEARDVALGYDARPVVEGLEFRARAGDRIGVLGPNGGGKTTLFRALAGELAPLRGVLERPPRCGVVPQTERSRLDFPVSALDVALMGAVSRRSWWQRPSRGDRALARAALGRVGLRSLADATFGDLSGGQRQRVLIARALVQDAAVVLLDEPFGGLDSASADLLTGLLDELAREGRAVLVATHDVDQARAWDLVLCLNRRQLAFGDPAAVLTRETLERTYGGAIVELPGDGGRCVLPPHHHAHEQETA
jgi:ABC-type Mn2+/Zn2+ transport system ATPase subunit